MILIKSYNYNLSINKMNKVILDKIKHIRANKKIKLGLAHGVLMYFMLAH